MEWRLLKRDHQSEKLKQLIYAGPNPNCREIIGNARDGSP